MPYIVTQKKQNIENDIIEARKSAQEYIHNVNQHCLIIDGEIEKVKHKIEMFADSLYQIFVLQDVREFEDVLRHLDQMLDECLPQKNKRTQLISNWGLSGS
jgi:rRNA pseudouridine-1189 N-methylase Emg1 (Nep1/Mra1 family)